MAGLDSLLKMLGENDADELQLRTDAAPRILRHGTPLRLSIPPTSHEILQLLLGPLLTPEREAELRDGKRHTLSYAAASGEGFDASIELAAGATPSYVAVFRRRAAAPPAPRVETPVLSRFAVPERPTPASTSVAPSKLAPAPTGGALPASLLALLRRAVAARASDLHLYSGELPALRVDGGLRALADERPVVVDTLVEGWLDATALTTLGSGGSLDLARDVEGVGRCRFNIYRAGGRLAAAVRLLPRVSPGLDELRLPLALDELVRVPHGLVIVCGPSGSGKSTTLAALARTALASSARRGHARMLISLEDPVEFVIHASEGGLVRQRQVGSDVRDFPTGLRDALREDPDVLLIGEMRDAETISLAMTAAETGHLVLTSLHSRSATGSIERIVDTYPAGRQQQIRVQLAESLRAVVAQRLVPGIHGGARVPALEVLRATNAVTNLIREGKTSQIATAMQAGRKDGMLTLERCLAELVRAGHVDRDEAIIAANDADALASYLTPQDWPRDG